MCKDLELGIGIIKHNMNNTCNRCGGLQLCDLYIGDVMGKVCHCTVKNYNPTEKTCVENLAPHTHGEHGSHTELDVYSGLLQFICLDDGVIYEEIEITRDIKE